MMTTEEAPGRATVAQRWLARSAIVAAVGSVLVPLLAIGFRASLAVTITGVVGPALTLAAMWWALTHKGLARWLAVAVAVAAPLVVLVLYTSRGLLWVVLVALGLLVLAVVAGRAALTGDPAPERMREHDAPPPKRPYLIMNPRSGGGKVTRFGLKDKAEALGAKVALLEGPGPVDVGELARTAVADGADLLGVAGGDGTQALVAGIAAEHNLPLLVISAGTRNHFALTSGWTGKTRPGAWRRSPTGSSCGSTWGSSLAARSSTTPPSGPMPLSCRARPTATTRPAPPWTSCQGCWPGSRGRAWWPGPRT
jgi:hypothetical protein